MAERSERPARGEKRSKRKVCVFCADKVTEIDYKDTFKLRKFISREVEDCPRRISGNCAKHQREVSEQ